MGMLIASELQAASLPRDKTADNPPPPSTHFHFHCPPLPPPNPFGEDGRQTRSEEEESHLLRRINLRMR